MNSYFYRTPATAHESIKFRRWIDDGAVDDRYWGENCCYPNCKYLLVCFSGHKKELCYWPFIVEAYETEVDGRGSVADIARVPHRKRFQSVQWKNSKSVIKAVECERRRKSEAFPPMQKIYTLRAFNGYSRARCFMCNRQAHSTLLTLMELHNEMQFVLLNLYEH